MRKIVFVRLHRRTKLCCCSRRCCNNSVNMTATYCRNIVFRGLPAAGKIEKRVLTTPHGRRHSIVIQRRGVINTGQNSVIGFGDALDKGRGNTPAGVSGEVPYFLSGKTLINRLDSGKRDSHHSAGTESFGRFDADFAFEELDPLADIVGTHTFWRGGGVVADAIVFN